MKNTWEISVTFTDHLDHTWKGKMVLTDQMLTEGALSSEAVICQIATNLYSDIQADLEATYNSEED